MTRGGVSQGISFAPPGDHKPHDPAPAGEMRDSLYNLTDLKTVRALMTRYNVNFSKSLGQNFLVNAQIPERIAAQSGIGPGWGVIEIGPGIGCLTGQLALRCDKVVAIEIDRGLIPVLKETMAEFDQVKIVHADVLKTDLGRMIKEEFAGLRVAVCANLPYYLSTPIIMALLRYPEIERITLMLQKELGQRICSAEGSKKYGALSVAVQYATEAKILFDVGAGNFVPRPKVDSLVISLARREKPRFTPADEGFFFKLVRAAFSQRRKTLANAIFNAKIVTCEKVDIEQSLIGLGLRPDVRAEKLAIAYFVRLSDKLISFI